ncbi:12923_t:CDS:2 [Funneliformis mosseae]|uniref:12923_t:CDS:1 n=1 Tax=Funneliformis mosseae TaxID=27381 RepID=A0A9N9I6F0_FUNMO|nr:12923_t:CDS:2 [Funneliformis mosseae]
MHQLSKIASYYWKEEPENVKAFYSKLSEDAKSLYKLENPIQILFDKNMNKVEVLHIINKVDSNYVNYTQGNENPVENMQNSTIGFPNSNFFEDLNLINQIPNNQVYIKKLECENVQFSSLHIDSDYIQVFEVSVKDIIFTSLNFYLLIEEDYYICNFFDREYGMDYIFTNFISVENNLKNVSTYGINSKYINNGIGEALSIENMNMYLFKDQ